MSTPIKTYVINLAEATERRRFMEAHLALFPFLDVEFVSAIRGGDLSAEELSRCVDVNACRDLVGRELYPGELGCALSHLEAMKRMEAEKEARALILEDDALVSGMLHRIVDELDEAIRFDGPSVILMTPCEYVAAGGRALSNDYAIRPVFEAFYATGYLINGEAARVLRRELLPLKMPIDWWKAIRSLTGINLAALVPYCVGLSLSENMHSSTAARNGNGTDAQTEKPATGLLAAFLDFLKRARRGINARMRRIKAQRIVF